jgi:hypothetical protein
MTLHAANRRPTRARKRALPGMRVRLFPPLLRLRERLRVLSCGEAGVVNGNHRLTSAVAGTTLTVLGDETTDAGGCPQLPLGRFPGL